MIALPVGASDLIAFTITIDDHDIALAAGRSVGHLSLEPKRNSNAAKLYDPMRAQRERGDRPVRHDRRSMMARPVRVELDSLAGLRNVGKAALADFKLLGIATVSQLATQDADTLYIQLCETTGQRHDPCVHDVFTATIHQAKTGEAVDWWAYTAARKSRQASGIFPKGLF